MRSPIKYSGVDKMKHKILKTLLAVAIATMTFCVEAATETVNGIKWTYIVKDGEAILGGGDFIRAIPKSTSGAITIPSTLGGYPVTRIGGSAFFGCSSLTGVTIPNSVTSIGDWAFSECGELTIFTDKGNADRLRKMLENAGANVKEIIEQKAKEQDAEEQESRGIRWWLVLGCVGTVVILGGLFFWIVRRKNKREGASDKTSH